MYENDIHYDELDLFAETDATSVEKDKYKIYVYHNDNKNHHILLMDFFHKSDKLIGYPKTFSLSRTKDNKPYLGYQDGHKVLKNIELHNFNLTTIRDPLNLNISIIKDRLRKKELPNQFLKPICGLKIEIEYYWLLYYIENNFQFLSSNLKDKNDNLNKGKIIHTLIIDASINAPNFIINNNICKVSVSLINNIIQNMNLITLTSRSIRKDLLQKNIEDAFKERENISIGKNYEHIKEQFKSNEHRYDSKETQIKQIDNIRASVNSRKSNKNEINSELNSAIFQLNQDFEKVSLEKFINKYEEAISKKRDEKWWQELFNKNQFILQMLFPYPIIYFEKEYYIKSHRTKIPDFKAQSEITNNIVIIELKKPDTKLLAQDTYRAGLHKISTELSNAINQVNDQIYHINNIKKNIEFNNYACDAVLIIGNLQKLTTEDKKKSFEIYRNSFKTLKIITFDEIIEKVKNLKKLILESP